MAGGILAAQNNLSARSFELRRSNSNPATPTTPPTQGQGPVNNTETQAAILKLAYPSVTPKYFMTITASQYSRVDLMQLGKLNPVASDVMPLPRSLVDSTRVVYDQTPMGAMLGEATNLLGKAMGGGQLKTNNDAAAGVAGQAAPGGVIENAGAAITAAQAALGNISEVTGAMMGYAPNQFMTILLKGPEYKRHSFSWMLSPDTYEESQAINKIIRNLKEWSAPGLALAGAVFTFPYVFQINFTPNEKLLYSFKPAVLESISVDFTPNEGAAFYRAGNDGQNAPESVSIQMQFLELEFWLGGRGDFS